jgi:hypothetical protein
MQIVPSYINLKANRVDWRVDMCTEGPRSRARNNCHSRFRRWCSERAKQLASEKIIAALTATPHHAASTRERWGRSAFIFFILGLFFQKKICVELFDL